MLQALNLPKKVYFKPGCMPVALRELGDIYRCQRALLVTDPELYRAGIAAPVADRLRKQEIRVAEFFTIGKRVSFGDLRSALPKLSEFQPDVIVGVGGNNAMSAAKALLALYQEPELDLAAAAADSKRIPACTKAKLVLVATNFSSGAQNSPFAMLENDSGQNCSLKSIHLLPEISVTDADFTATLTAEQARTCALEILSHAARAYLDHRASPIFQRSRRFPSMTTTCAAPNWRSVWGLMIAGLCLQPVRHFRMCRRSVFFAYAREYVW